MRYKNIFAAALMGFCFVANADNYPTREVSLIVPYGPGGATDIASRLLAEEMAKHLGVPVIIENKPGAGGMLGVGYIARQKPDGYKIGVMPTSSTALAPYISGVSFELDDLDFVASVAAYQFGLAVKSDSPYKSTEDLIKASKDKDGLFFGVTSVSFALSGIKLGELTGGKFEVVNYKSGSEAITELLGGRLDVLAQHPSVITPQVKAGKVRFIASTGEKRWPDFPDSPTLHEQGYDVRLSSEIAIVAPANTPEPILEKLRLAAFKAVENPELQKRFQDMGLEAIKKSGVVVKKETYDNFKASAEDLKAYNKDWVLKKCFVDCK